MIEFTHLKNNEDPRSPGFGEIYTITERSLMDKIKELESKLKVITEEMTLAEREAIINCHAGARVLEARIAELEAQLPKVSVVRYYAGDFVCECGWTVDDGGFAGDSKFNFCPGCGSKLDFTEVEK
jgi:predicted nucleic acid binding AN1-type Zn finger protein